MAILSKRRDRTPLFPVYRDPEFLFPASVAMRIDEFRDTSAGDPKKSPLTKANRETLLVDGGLLGVRLEKGRSGWDPMIAVLSDLLDFATDVVVINTNDLVTRLEDERVLPLYEMSFAEMLVDIDVLVMQIGDPSGYGKAERNALAKILTDRHGVGTTIICSSDLRAIAGFAAELLGPMMIQKWFLVGRKKGGKTSYSVIEDSWLETKTKTEEESW